MCENVSKWIKTCQNVSNRVEFSKPNIEISITVTKALKLRSFSWLYSHNFHHFHLYVPHPSHYFPQQYFFSFWQLFCTVKRVQKSKKKDNSPKKYMHYHAKRKNHEKML